MAAYLVQQQKRQKVHEELSHEKYGVPPGFKFQPTHEQLVDYLISKIKNNQHQTPVPIHDYDVYKDTIQELTEKYPCVDEEASTREWYFYTKRERKYGKGHIPNRSAAGQGGYWMASGGDKEIVSYKNKSDIVGFKKQLVYYHGQRPKGIKTNWHMTEYKLEKKKLDDVVLCKIYIKKEKNNEQQMLLDVTAYYNEQQHYQEPDATDNNNMIAENQFVQSYSSEVPDAGIHGQYNLPRRFRLEQNNYNEDYLNTYSTGSGEDIFFTLEELMGKSSIEEGAATMPQNYPDALQRQDPTA